MSITSALSNALSGLSASTRAADIVASNVANAMTEGYGRRDIELSTRTVGRSASGVEVVGVSRQHDPVVTGERRLADAQVGLEQTRVDYFERLERALGRPDDANSISGLVVGFESSLIEASNHPESDAHLNTVVNSAQALTDRINEAATTITALRQDADHNIDHTVTRLQNALDHVVQINVEIQEHVTSGYDSSALVDQRQVLIDQISEIVPVKEVMRDHGMVSLYTPGGSILVDSKAATIEFDRTNTISPDMVVSGGVLSGLTINGQPVSTSADRGAIAGGTLAGLFEIRDVLAVDAQTKLDSYARDLMQRFEDTGLDATLNPGDPGLFTDAGAAFDPLEEVGLSNRLSLNAAVIPTQGGDLWKIRDGLGAVTQGNAGNASIIQAMVDRLQDGVVTASGGFSAMERSSLGLSSDLFSVIDTQRISAEGDLAFAASKQTSLKSIELELGVDTDNEMQELLIIEQTYSANAKVIETIDSLLDELLRIA